VCPFVAGNSTLHVMLVVQRVIYHGSSWSLSNGFTLNFVICTVALQLQSYFRLASICSVKHLLMAQAVL
jgi:hypothetical protein